MQIRSPIQDARTWYRFPSQPNPTSGVRWKPYAKGTGRPWPGTATRGDREVQLRGLAAAPKPIRAGAYVGAPGKEVALQGLGGLGCASCGGAMPVRGGASVEGSMAPLRGLEARHLAAQLEGAGLRGLEALSGLAGFGAISWKDACKVGGALLRAAGTAGKALWARDPSKKGWGTRGEYAGAAAAAALGEDMQRACSGDAAARRRVEQAVESNRELQRQLQQLQQQILEAEARRAQQPKEWIPGVPNAAVVLGVLGAVLLLRK